MLADEQYVDGSSPSGGTVQSIIETKTGFKRKLIVRTTETKFEAISAIEQEGNALFNDALNIFYLRLYGVGHMVKDHSDSERGNPLPPHGLLCPVSSKGSVICIIPQTG